MKYHFPIGRVTDQEDKSKTQKSMTDDTKESDFLTKLSRSCILLTADKNLMTAEEVGKRKTLTSRRKKIMPIRSRNFEIRIDKELKIRFPWIVLPWWE